MAAFNLVKSLLPFSDAAEGPFSGLTAAGESIIKTIAAGVTSAGALIKTAFDAAVGSDTFKALTSAWDAMTGGMICGAGSPPSSRLRSRGSAWTAMTAGLKGPVWGWLAEKVEAPFKWVTSAWDSTLAWLGVPEEGLWAWLSEATPGIFDWLKDGMGHRARLAQGSGRRRDGVGVAVDPVLGIFDWLKTAWDGWHGTPRSDWLKTAWDTALGWLKGPEQTVGEDIWGTFAPESGGATLLDRIQTQWGGAGRVAGGAVAVSGGREAARIPGRGVRGFQGAIPGAGSRLLRCGAERSGRISAKDSRRQSST